MGDGAPANGIQYQNDTASDFGVNLDADGNLRGLAYGANIGWISFDNSGAPRVDLLNGVLNGYVYGANVGWIALSGPSFSMQVDSVAAGADRDGDGIADAWELSYAGDLSTFSASGDYDGDGQSDLQEYLADTNPADRADHLEIVGVSLGPDGATLTWSTKPTRLYQVETRPDWDPTHPWLDAGLGLQLPDGDVTTRTIPAGVSRGFFRIQVLRPLSP